MYIGSVYNDQDELLMAISSLYLDGKTFDLDPCFNKGFFYNKLGRPQHIGDIKPLYKWCPVMDVTKLHFSLWNLKSAVFDPPFLVGSGHMVKRYGGFKTVKDMYLFFNEALLNFIRVLKRGGILVIKIQDASAGGQNYFSHINIATVAQGVGFELIDIFVLVNKNRMRKKAKVSRMANKEHCFFMVFRRVERKIRVSKF